MTTWRAGLWMAALACLGAMAWAGEQAVKDADAPIARVAARGGVTFLENFPYQYISEQPDAMPVEIRADSNNRPPVPILRDKKEGYLWEAWICNNDQCPHRREHDRPKFFPLVDERLRAWTDGGRQADPPMPELTAPPQCPVCRKMNVDVYYTPEGKKVMNEYRERVMKAYGR